MELRTIGFTLCSRTGSVIKALATTALCLIAAALPAAAMAETDRPIQSQQTNALPLIHLPATDQSANICLVDTGVDLNHDTQSAIIDRMAFGGASLGDAHPQKHGTQMAMVMAAPINGWGMVGAWPAARIFSVHVLGVTYFPRGIYECLRYAPTHNIKVINLSLGAPGILPGDDPQLINAIAGAKRDGINVVAAAGNDGGALDAPANHPGVLGVGGVDRAGFLCRYGTGGSASGRELDINASGCDLNLAFPTDGRAARGGATSEATAFTSAALAALRSYRPDLTPDAAEQLLLDSATPIPAGRLLNVGGAFVAAGLSGVWNQVAAHVGPAPGPVQTQGPAPTSSQPLAPSGPAASPRPATPGSSDLLPRPTHH